jgi:hypothetical protein
MKRYYEIETVLKGFITEAKEEMKRAIAFEDITDYKSKPISILSLLEK